MGFSCDSEVSLAKVLPWQSAPRLMPIPSIVSSIISLIIASFFKDPGLLFTSRFQGNEGFLQVAPIGTVGSGTLLWCEREVVVEGSHDETTCIMHGCALGCEIGENLIEYLGSLNLDRISAGASPRGPPIGLVLDSRDVCILAHFQVNVLHVASGFV